MEFLDFSERKNRYVRETDLEKEYVSEMIKKVAEDQSYYPKYHIAPPHGLLNDPNGLYQDDQGYYNLFYQWFLFGTVHGLKHWHQLKTKDFIHYVDYGAVLIPEKPFDFYGCYTGMVLKENDAVHIFYTGIIDKKAEELIPVTVHAQIIDDKIVKSGIVEEVNLEKTTYDFRDPFVFKRDSIYYMLTGAQSPKNEGILTVSSSEDPKKRFKSLGNLRLKDSDFGYMLECPNYFETAETGVLIFSPQGIESQNKYDYRNVFSVVYAVGEKIDLDRLAFDYEDYFELDKGFDFYAPQVFKDNQQRMILYGWLGNSKTAYPSDEYQWSHMLTIPREIVISGNRIKQTPLRELDDLRMKEEKNLTRKENSGKSIELSFNTSIAKLRIENEKGAFIEFSMNETEYCLDRQYSTLLYNEQYGQQRYAKRLNKMAHNCRVFIDHSSIELFIDDGLTVFTGRFFLAGNWTITCEKGFFDYYELSPINIDVIN